jgi:predicted nucleotidyltransferase
MNAKSNLKEFESVQRSLEDVKQRLQELKPTLRKRFKVESIEIFGS